MNRIANMLGLKRFRTYSLSGCDCCSVDSDVVFLSDSSLIKRIRYDTQIRELETQIDYSQQQTASDMDKLHELRSNDEDLEKFARENYLMKKENEDVFIID